MDYTTSVVMEFLDQDNEISIQIKLKNYNTTLLPKYDNSKLKIHVERTRDLELFAVPVECSPDNIEVLPLIPQEDSLEIDASSVLSKFIVFSAFINNSSDIALPRFVTTEPDTIQTFDRNERIWQFKNKLLDTDANSHYWKTILNYFKICINTGIPFSTFDIFRAVSISPDLIPRMFCFLNVNYEENDFIDRVCKRIEEDLGFSFHWISKNQWNKAIDWLKESYRSRISNDVLHKILIDSLEVLFISNEPLEWFKKIHELIWQEKKTQNVFHVPTEIISLRQNLSVRVLNELPEECPKIEDDYKYILPVTRETAPVKILLKTPLAIALTLTEKDGRLWAEDEYTMQIRRNMQYCQSIAPDWYGKAIFYCLNELIK
jgi:hypothetical protein